MKSVAQYDSRGYVRADSPLDPVLMACHRARESAILLTLKFGVYWGICATCGERYLCYPYAVFPRKDWAARPDISVPKYCVRGHELTWAHHREFEVVTSEQDRQEQYDAWLARLRKEIA